MPPPGCERLAPGAPATVEFGPPGIVVVGAGPAALALRRYAGLQFPIDLGEAAGGRPVAVAIRPDGSSVPWTLAVTATTPARVCEPGSSLPGPAG